ncbi:CHAT domain-containing protein [Actinoplanes sp. NPDC051411]|uniref:CHAT domain-containing protein n=1 Tax=Actinoplanes sp. NPDC051411 TaxID=3155522 RepID=UPI00344664AE
MGDINIGQQIGDRFKGDKNVYSREAFQPPAAARKPATILLLSANAAGHPLLQLDQERRAIVEEVARSRGAARLEVRPADAVRLDDLQRVLMRYKPIVVQFSGHGHPSDGIQVLDEFGQPRSVKPEALSELFRILNRGLRCVVLNACHTDAQAEAIAWHVPCVVGMRRQVLDDTAIQFSKGFYRALADGRSIRTSFDLARNSLNLHDVPDSDVPRLIARPGDADRPLIEAR